MVDVWRLVRRRPDRSQFSLSWLLGPHSSSLTWHLTLAPYRLTSHLSLGLDFGANAFPSGQTHGKLVLMEPLVIVIAKGDKKLMLLPQMAKRLALKYEQIVDRESAYERLSQATHTTVQSGGEHRGLVEQVVSGVIGGISGQRSR